MAQLIFLGVCNLAGQWLYPIFGGYLYSAVELYGRKMTKKLLLHIGTTKTGNTSIHQALVHAKAKGDLGQVCYPRRFQGPSATRVNELRLLTSEPFEASRCRPAEASGSHGSYVVGC